MEQKSSAPFARSIMFSFAIFITVNGVNSSELPDGIGKENVEGACTACHRTNQITRSSGYTRQGWIELIGSMVDFSQNPEQQIKVTNYLSSHFPQNNKRAPKLVPGDIKLKFKEWKVPTLGQRSRDPIQDQNGTIWWAGQWGNLIGRISPQTGEIKEYPLPAGSMPHSVTVDVKGNIWYTGNKNGTVGKLDPKSEKITVYKMPDPEARDPHTAIFDKQGILWFTLQQSNMVGRLDPESGEIKLVTMKTPGSRPYGIKIDHQGTPWIACNGSNCLVKVEPTTMKLTEIKLPLSGTTVRRLDISEDGMIWYVNSSKGRLGRYNPKTSEIKEWNSPRGSRSQPYALAIVNGAIWYNGSRTRPDALVRFDPHTEKFQSWAIPSGNIYAGIVRHMRATRDGNLLIHQSSTNRIILVELKK